MGEPLPAQSAAGGPPEVPSGPGRWSRHVLQARLVAAIATVTWREVESGDVSATGSGPVLLVSNHFGGAADAIVLMSVLPRRPRILADDAIWRYPVAKQVMEWIGAIPVHRGRGASGGGPRGGQDNSDMFRACHDALGAGEVVLIFPEGITREEPSIGQVRSGAARIALGARSAGVSGIRIIPVGIHYDDKAAFRSTVYVREGQPIDLDGVLEEVATSGSSRGGAVTDEVPAATRPDPDGQHSGRAGENAEWTHEEVEQLTELVEERLRAAAPNYDDWREARALQTAAEAYLRDLEPTRSVPIGLRDRLGGWLAARPGHGRIEEAAGDYRDALSHTGLNDAWATEGAAGLRGKSFVTVLTWLLMLPYAIGGVVMHGIPLVLSWLVSRLRLAPAVMATILPVASAVLFVIATVFWLVVGWLFDAWVGVFLVAVMSPVSFAALVAVAERAQLWMRGLRNRVFGIRHSLTELARQRQQVVELVSDEITSALATAAGDQELGR